MLTYYALPPPQKIRVLPAVGKDPESQRSEKIKVCRVDHPGVLVVCRPSGLCVISAHSDESEMRVGDSCYPFGCFGDFMASLGHVIVCENRQTRGSTPVCEDRKLGAVRPSVGAVGPSERTGNQGQ